VANFNLKGISHLSFSAQNCNSLNVSTNCPKQLKKVAAILALQTTFVFLSDIRLNLGINSQCDLFNPRYKMLHNSTSSKRGVAILISSQLHYNILYEFRDNNNNMLGVRISIGDCEVLLISIYGPNTNDLSFFQDLRKILNDNQNIPCICAGDWNLTFSTCGTDDNIDILNMNNPPSIYRSGQLAAICEDFSLTDPFRVLHYRSRDYTFVPRHGGRNRSRIDFFLISEGLIAICNKCTIAPSLDTILFDHKHIKLDFGVSLGRSRHFIKPNIFSHSRFKAVVSAAAVETYLQHAARDQPDVDIEEGLLDIGRLINKIKQANELEFEIAFRCPNDELSLQFRVCEEELNNLVNYLPDPSRLDDIILTCQPDTFLEIL
jgi:exonuclease III